MNGKRAKRLRDAARKYTVGKPPVQYELYQKKNPSTGVSYHIRMVEGCTRWVYKQLKKVATGKPHRIEATVNTSSRRT